MCVVVNAAEIVIDRCLSEGLAALLPEYHGIKDGWWLLRVHALAIRLHQLMVIVATNKLLECNQAKSVRCHF